jgi:KDO2-lipid IV(A) lauroyltransferase
VGSPQPANREAISPSMPDLTYRDRAHLFAHERLFRLGNDTLEIVEGNRRRHVRYADIKFVESFLVRLPGTRPGYRRWIAHIAGDRPLTLTAVARKGWRLVDQSEAFRAFGLELERRVVAVNPEFFFISGRLLLNRAGGLGGRIAVRLMRFIRRTNPDRWADVAAFIMRHLGPRLHGNRRVLHQLALAFPEKTQAERERIAVGMWNNLARTIVEYAHLDTLWDHDPARPGSGRIVMDEASAQVWVRHRALNKPALGFSMHYGNWELTAIAIAKHGLKGLVPYRRAKNEALTEELVRMRTAAGITLLPASRMMIADIKSQFGPGVIIGMLIDQHYAHGVEVTMFGRPTRLNPLFVRLARIYNCPIYGSRTVRLPDRRLFYQAVGPIAPARDTDGRVDVQATMQILATLMEGWIREHPEQWMWLQPIWR